MRLVNVYETLDAPRILYQLLQERVDDDTINISHRTMPSHEEHMAFFISRPYPIWEFIQEGDWVGYVSLTVRNEIGIFIFKRYQGKGYGPKAVKAFMKKHPQSMDPESVRLGGYLANINPKNERSKALFEGLGFKKIQETYRL